MTEIEEKLNGYIDPIPGTAYPLKLVYCGQCTLPLEYCEYSPNPEKCKEWLQKFLPEMFEGQVAVGEDAASGDAAAEKKRQKRGGKGATKAPKSTMAEPKTIQLTRASRGKNKFVTVIKDLGSHGVDLKVAAKTFSQKYACGASATGDDEIIIQGDVKDDLFDFIPHKWKQVDEDSIEDCGDQKR